MLVATDRSTEYTALPMGCIAQLAFLTTLGVTARLTARPGRIARRTLRGTSNLEMKPTWPVLEPVYIAVPICTSGEARTAITWHGWSSSCLMA
jgi:hypothetical protein